jgi:hypothetical protein
MQKPIEQVERNLFFPDRSADHEVIESHHQVAGPWEYSPEDPSYLREVLDDIKRRLDNLEFERRQIAISNSNLNTKDVTFYNWLKSEYKNRSVRSAFFSDDYMFGEPGWDILLDLCAAEIDGKRISITSSCLASGVASTTALRWIQVLQKDGYLERVPDEGDKRRSWLRISESGFRSLASYYKRVILGIRESRDGMTRA